MKIKVHYDQNTHDFADFPSTLQAMKDNITSNFKDLPSTYHLEVKGKEGDKLIISDDQVYQNLLKDNAENEFLNINVVTSVAEPSEKNSANTDQGSKNKKKKRNPPVLIQNKDEFAEDLQHVGESHIINRLEQGEAPSDESLPSSVEDHEEKVLEMIETIEDIKNQGAAELKPRILTEPDTEQEPQITKKVKPNSDVEAQIGNGSEHGNGNGNENGQQNAGTA